MGSKVRPADPPPRTVITDIGQIGCLFRQARQSIGISAATLGAQLGCTQSTVTHREIGKTFFDGLQHALDQAAALGYRFVLEPVEPEVHIIQIDEDEPGGGWGGGWTLKHPLSCRPDLFDCPVNLAAHTFGRHDLAPFPPGRYECSLSDLGDRILIGDRVDA